MFGALFSFLGGSVFRMVWGEIASFVQKKQDHQHEQEMVRLQAALDDSRHKREMERLRLQSDLDVKEIQVAGDIQINAKETDAFIEAIKASAVPTGVKWVDAWNGSIRPAAASIALMLWVLALANAGFSIGDWDRELVGVVLGFYFADRSLGKRGK